MAKTKYHHAIFNVEDAALIARVTDSEVVDSFTKAAQAMVADGLKYRMSRHLKPISNSYLDMLKPRGAFNTYKMFEEAIEAEQKEQPGNYRLELIPDGSKYADNGREAYMPLHSGEMFGPDGEVWFKKD